MVTINNSDLFLLFASALFGLMAGIIGNWLVSSSFRLLDHAIVDLTPRKKLGIDLLLFGAGVVGLGVFTYIISRLLETVAQSP